jgi:hypothetical protein
MQASLPNNLSLNAFFNYQPKSGQLSRIKVLTYDHGSYNKYRVTVWKYPDGTVTLQDGPILFIQRPAHYPDRLLQQIARFVKKLFSQELSQ